MKLYEQVFREKTDIGFDPKIVKRDFPILERSVNGKRLVYLDNAATTQKPKAVIEALNRYYTYQNANVHRGLHALAEEATTAFEGTRDKIAQFIGGAKREEIIFTRNATEAINLVAESWGRSRLKKGDRIVITQMEHHANLIPWLILSQRTGAEMVYIPVDRNGFLNLSDIGDIISDKTKIVALTQMSNVLGTINPVEEIIRIAHKKGAIALIDAAQSAPHMPVDVKEMDADFLAFSGHKMLGPTGIGILYGKEDLLNAMEPVLFGGEMISDVQFDRVRWNALPWKFEAGTPSIAEAIAFAPAIDYLNELGMNNIRRHERELTRYALNRMTELRFITVYGPTDADSRGGAISFNDKDIHPHDLATFLDALGIAVRAGHHCAQPLTRLLGVQATTRASFYIYNDKSDIDELIHGLKEARKYFRYDRTS
jgi:cysteine desulfurase/selenocysteine lyase